LWQQAKTQRDEKELQRLAAVKAQADAERSAEQLRVAFDENDQRRAAELELREHAYDLEGELESVESEIARLGNERTRTKSQLQQRSDLIQKLRKQLNEVASESTKISELETELARSVSEMDQIQQANEKIVGQLELRASEVTRLREKLSAAELEKRRIRQQLDAQFRRSRGQPARRTSAKQNPPNASEISSPTKKR
jgi:chromosome segregation ATPase